MTQEEKELLLKDLCGRLPYGVRVDVSRVEEWKELTLTPFILSNYYDDIEKIKKKVPNQLWLRNNVATIVSNVLENYFFIFFAFVGLYDIPTMLNIATTISVVEIVIAVFDTPFLYISKKLK